MDFDDTEAAFKDRTAAELTRARRIFKSFDGRPKKKRTAIAKFLLRKRIWLTKTVIRKLVGFDHFYGGESLLEAGSVIGKLSQQRIRSALDYSVESVATEDGLDATYSEMMRAIAFATGNPNIPYVVFKVSGLAREPLLRRMSALLTGKSIIEAASTTVLPLTAGEQEELMKVRGRLHSLCTAARMSKLRMLVDAEHTWVQPAIDWLALHLMYEFNRETAVVFNTIQMYRVKRFDYLEALHAFGNSSVFTPGIKLVRGAYEDEERATARSSGLPDPILPTQEATHSAFDNALVFCVDRIDDLALVVGTHNENSLRLLVDRLAKGGLNANDPRVEVAQLLGMRDNASILMAVHGYNVCKYIPYGPLREAFPYLARRAAENKSIGEQMGRDRELIERELHRRKTTA